MSESVGLKRKAVALLKEPLLHFLGLGGLLFVAFMALNGNAPSDDAAIITVDRQALLTYMQYRSKAFETNIFSQELDAMPNGERQALIDDYVKEEALYREARAMGLAENDYVIRQRVIQSLKFLLNDAASRMQAPTDEQLEAYLAANKAAYAEPAAYTFTHVFFDAARHGDAEAKSMATALLPRLQAGVSFDEAPQYGERFPYFTNYVDRRRDFVESHFGNAMINALDGLDPQKPQWAGPFKSPYGWHLVLLTRRKAARFPNLDELRGRLVEDYERDRQELDRRAAIDRVVEHYKVQLSDDLNE